MDPQEERQARLRSKFMNRESKLPKLRLIAKNMEKEKENTDKPPKSI